MDEETAGKAAQPRRVGRSIVALLAGFVVNVALSLATDFSLEVARVLPPVGHGAMNNAQSLLAATYRTIYAVISSYVVARLAPYGALGHALTGGAVGMLLASVGMIVTWNQALGPHWYPISLVLTALPAAWVGGKLGQRSSGQHR